MTACLPPALEKCFFDPGSRNMEAAFLKPSKQTFLWADTCVSLARCEHPDRTSLHEMENRRGPSRPDRGWRYVRNTSRKWRIGGCVVWCVPSWQGKYLWCPYPEPRCPCGGSKFRELEWLATARCAGGSHPRTLTPRTVYNFSTSTVLAQRRATPHMETKIGAWVRVTCMRAMCDNCVCSGGRVDEGPSRKSRKNWFVHFCMFSSHDFCVKLLGRTGDLLSSSIA